MYTLFRVARIFYEIRQVKRNHPVSSGVSLIRDCRLLFHKNDYSDEFIDTNYYKQNKQNDDFELYVTKDRFYKAHGTLPTETPTDFD